MRSEGVLAAQWSNDGALLACTLGPKPVTTEPQRPHQPSELELRNERRRIALAAGSGLVRKVGEP